MTNYTSKQGHVKWDPKESTCLYSTDKMLKLLG